MIEAGSFLARIKYENRRNEVGKARVNSEPGVNQVYNSNLCTISAPI